MLKTLTSPVFILLLATIIFAQTPITKLKTQSSSLKSGMFSRLDAEFVVEFPIDLLSGGDEILDLTNTEGLGKGRKHKWNARDIYFEIQHINLEQQLLSEKQKKEFIEKRQTILKTNIESNQSKIIDEKDGSLPNSIGFELKFATANSTVFIREYLFRNRLYRVFTGFTNLQSEEAALKFLNSFQFVDKQKLVEMRVAEATPEDLPQPPAVKKVKSDAEDLRLKGKVKSVLQEYEDIQEKTRQRISGYNFDKDKNLLKAIIYYDNVPDTIAVYGYLDGMRVLRLGLVKSDDSVFGVMATIKPQKPRDTRYTNRLEYSYDEKSRIKERIFYQNNGELDRKTAYVYSEQKIERSESDKDGKQTFKGTEILDNKGNVIEESYLWLTSKSPERKYSYKYEKLDKNGNWTKRTVSEWTTENDKSFYKPYKTEYRTISYYN